MTQYKPIYNLKDLMQTITDEQSIKNTSLFLKLEDKAKFTIQSHLVKIDTAYVDKLGSILWNDSLLYKGLKKRVEYYYWGEVNEEAGVIRVPATVFFSLNENERLLEKNKRSYEWILSKSGQLKETKYSVVRGKDIEISEEDVAHNTDELCKILAGYEETLKGKLEKYLDVGEGDLKDPMNEKVDPDTIPF